ncbi:IclR family transcriptional regulator [Pusillimonas sp. MFBS29]|uniref:IclR family transcriptional regulator n=1 Tax=Pusillimonas sp. MFBS29 TaxID=2886690 RepID=UPI001D1290E4|nr:IclR family transcriptional regulator [Pusillimonas sp. MFBS29]MCC2594860.1 IclR family transcriptional regulator [Pusillimonas sp. MFBS29]
MTSFEPSSTGVVKSADRVLAILELFALRQQPLNLTQISSELGYPMSSVLALMKSLCAKGYVVLNPEQKTYSLTIRVPMLGTWVMGDLFQNGAVIALMDQIQKDTGETVILGAQNGLHAQYLHTVQSQKLLRYYLKPGLLRPMTRSAIGKALLMHHDDEALTAFAASANAASSLEKSYVDAAALIHEVGQLRKQGYAYTEGLTEGICAIGLPLRLTHGDCAVAVAGPVFRLRRKREKVVSIVRQLSGIYLNQYLGQGAL